MPDLAELLSRAERASLSERIELRDDIASFGRAAVGRVEAWLLEPRMAFFAIRVLERIAHDKRKPAVEALKRGLGTVSQAAKSDSRSAIPQRKLPRSA